MRELPRDARQNEGVVHVGPRWLLVVFARLNS